MKREMKLLIQLSTSDNQKLSTIAKRFMNMYYAAYVLIAFVILNSIFNLLK